MMMADSYTGVGTRKAHRKSRFGCVHCKRRRIKCDEAKPNCNNCIRHSVTCSYPASAVPSISCTPPASTPPAGTPPAVTPSSHNTEPSLTVKSTAINRPDFEWDAVAVELMHNYSISTCYSLTGERALESFYQVDIPKIGFQHHHVLHLLLGISAMHLSHFKPSRRSFYLEHADRQCQTGFQIATRVLLDISQDNCHSLFLFASLCSSVSIIKGPRPGNFLLFDDNGPSEWNSLFRGIKTVLESHTEEIMHGVLSPMIQAGISATRHGHQQLPSWESDQLARLRLMIENVSASTEDSQTLNDAVDSLHLLFSSRIGSDGQKVSLKFQAMGIWLYRCTDEFTSLLQRHQPAALAILAYACLPLNDLSSFWYMQNWVGHLLTGIWERLPREHRSWIQWPIQQVGWIPPEG